MVTDIEYRTFCIMD